jgi:HEAT repeat protein
MKTTILTLFIFCVTAPGQEPSRADFDAQIARLTPTASRDDRLRVAEWLTSNARSKHAPLGMPALEKLVRKDPDAEVRAKSVAALLLIANAHEKPCPLALVEALRDPHEDVRVNAAVGLFKQFEPGAVAVLLDGTGDKIPDVRSDCVMLLATVAPKDPKALAAIERAKADSNSNVRHSAHCARFKATDDLPEFLAYFIRLREDSASIKDRHPPGSEEEKHEQARFNLYQIGSAVRLVEWSNQRPAELATALVKLLDDKSAIMRRGAASLVGATAKKVELDPMPLWKNIPEALRPVIDPTVGAKKEGPPEPSPAALKLRELKVEDKLRELRDKDPDESVRIAAIIALKRLDEVPVRKK